MEDPLDAGTDDEEAEEFEHAYYRCALRTSGCMEWAGKEGC